LAAFDLYSGVKSTMFVYFTLLEPALKSIVINNSWLYDVELLSRNLASPIISLFAHNAFSKKRAPDSSRSALAFGERGIIESRVYS